MLIFLCVCGSLSHCPFCKWTRNCKQNHMCAKVIHSLDRNYQAWKSRNCKNRLIMEIFHSAIFIILLIWCYQLLTQYEETYEHHMRQCHLVVIRILWRWRCAARRFRWREHALMCARDARYTGTAKILVYIIFQMVRYHNFAQFGISYAAVAKCICRCQCFPNCCATGKCDNRTT